MTTEDAGRGEIPYSYVRQGLEALGLQMRRLRLPLRMACHPSSAVWCWLRALLIFVGPGLAAVAGFRKPEHLEDRMAEANDEEADKRHSHT